MSDHKPAGPSSISVEVSVAGSGWCAAGPEVEALAEAAARAAVGVAAGPLVLGVILTDDGEQRRLNRTWRGKDAPTNVLAFPVGGPPHPTLSPTGGEGRVRGRGAPVLLGDVVLAFETVAREAAEQQKPLADHLRHLVVHGVLHLLGFDHESETDAAIMEAREVEILRGLGVPDPYRDTM